jgi:ATP-binding cassette subfamily B protein
LFVRSAIPGRERWEVRGILREPEIARALQQCLLRRAIFTGVEADAVSGRVLLTFPRDSYIDIGRVLRDCLGVARATAREPRQAAGPNPLYRILKISLPPQNRLIAPPLLSAVGTGVSILQSVALLATINTALGKGPEFLKTLKSSGSRLTAITAISVALTALQLWLQYQRRLLWRHLARETQHRLRAKVVAHLEIQDLEFFDKHGSGRLMHLVTAETGQIEEFVESAGDGLIERALTILVGTITLFASSPRLALLALLPLPLFTLISRFFRHKVQERYTRSSQMSARYTQALENNLTGISVVKSFTAERLEARRLRHADWDLEEAALDAARASSQQSHLIRGIFSTGFCLTAGIGGQLVASGKIAAVEYNRAMYWVPQLLSALTGVDETTRLFHAATQSAKQLAELLDAGPSIRSGPVSLRKTAIRGDIVFENVTFGYAPDAPVLEDVSFELRHGETLGIVGSTGSGKSTLLRLLLRFYEPGAGRILVDGVNIRELNLRDLRSAIGLVSQDVYLFQGTVRSNILYGRPGASDEEVAGALDVAGAPGLLETLPGGLNAEVGERGLRLSGGERQRVAIARALLKEPPVLALDEATSHLDYETESMVKRSLRGAAKGKSVILIAHRLSTIRDADKILVLEKGRIREEGTHRQLVDRRGLYASLWRLQSGKL